MKKNISSIVLIVLFSLSLCHQVFAATSLTLYDDFNDNTIDPVKWLILRSENASAITEDNGTLNINGEFEKGQKVAAVLVGPDRSFDALEAKIKLSSETEQVPMFGIVATLWSDGISDYLVLIYFSRLYKDAPLMIQGGVLKTLGQNNVVFFQGNVLIENASYDTWYRIRMERDGTEVYFYAKEGSESLEPDDVKYTYAIPDIIEPPAFNVIYLNAENQHIFDTIPIAGSFDDVSVGNATATYTISGKIEGPLCDNAAIALYDGVFPFTSQKVNADGTYAFRLLTDHRTYSVGSASPCCPLEPDRKTVTIQGADQKDINFTVKADNASAETVYAITGARLIDGNGGEPVDNALIIIKGDTIQSVSRAGEAEIPTGAQVIDAAGKTIIPGLHDMHVHILLESNPNFAPFYMPKEPVGVEYQKHLYAYLYCGVTSVLDVGSFTGEDLIFSLRKQEQDHCRLAPRIFTAGAGITYPHGYMFPYGLRVASNPEEAVKVVDDLAKRQPDMVKIFYENNLQGGRWPTFDTATLKALIDESRKLGLKTTVHISHPQLAKKLAPLQPDAFAHLPPGGRAVVAPMIKNNIACTPTLMTQYVGGFYLNPDIINVDIIGQCVDPRLISAYKDPALLKAIRKGRWIMRFMYYDHQRYFMLNRLFKAGNKIIMGSDAGGGAFIFHGPASHEEIGLYVEAGLTPLQAITIATRNGAEFLEKQDRQGTIEAGKLADLVILKADPLKDISNTKKIALVMKDGKIMDRGMLSRDITGRLSEEARYIADRIDLMPVAAFKDSDADNKEALTGMMEEIYSILKQADDSQIGLKDYTQASTVLSSSVMPLIDGCTNGSTDNDLITDCAYQKGVYAAAQQLGEDCLNK